MHALPDLLTLIQVTCGQSHLQVPQVKHPNWELPPHVWLCLQAAPALLRCGELAGLVGCLQPAHEQHMLHSTAAVGAYSVRAARLQPPWCARPLPSCATWFSTAATEHGSDYTAITCRNDTDPNDGVIRCRCGRYVSGHCYPDVCHGHPKGRNVSHTSLW